MKHALHLALPVLVGTALLSGCNPLNPFHDDSPLSAPVKEEPFTVYKPSEFNDCKSIKEQLKTIERVRAAQRDKKIAKRYSEKTLDDWSKGYQEMAQKKNCRI